MDCTGCGRENRDDARFCAGCGTPITVKCAACNRELAPDARFCDGCGTPVAEPATEDDAADAVRKTVTALFCDLMGSTTFAETVDPESAREAMARYHAMASAVIEGRGGTVAKFIGDGVMALFGVPEVAEDDAERAVATGIELQRGFEPIQRHIADRYGVELGLRVGVNTGEVVIAADDADIVGDALNTAARLEAACEPGEVLVGESTWRLTRATVKYEALGSVDVKGKAVPVATYQVIAEQAEEDELATPFVGRDDEMAVLTSTFADAVGAGAARFVTVVGSPGVGKTRLAAELVRGLGEEALAFDLRCERAGTATFAPVADLLREAADIDDGLAADEIGDRIGALVGSAGDGERIAELLGGFVGASPARSTEEMFFAVRRLIEILGRDRPVVLVVDDIQWAEPLFLDLLEHLAEWVNAAPALIVGLARPEIREVRPVLAEPGRRVAEVISLEGLDSAATEQLAAELVGGRALPSELVARLPASTEGNPLFVRELMRMLVDDGVIVDAGDSWALAIDAEAIEVPPTINSLLATRVERLSDTDRRVLELAAVVGPEFPRGAVGAVAGSLSRLEIDAALERLRRRELVEPTGSYWGDEPVFRFHHVLIRDAAYRRLLKGARAELHVAVGKWTEATAAGVVGEHDVAIGFHFEQAHDYRRELDLHDDETAALGRRAAALFRTAAERALERDDLAAAGALAARAVACLEDGDRSLAPLLLIGCEALLGTGAVTDGGPLVDRLAAVAVDDARLAAWADCYRAELRVLADPGGLVDAERTANAAAERLTAIDDQSGIAKARLVRAQALARLGRVGDCEAELDEALGAARQAGDDRRVTAVLGAAPQAALWGPSPVPRAGGRCLDVIRLLRITTGSPAVEAVSVRCQAVLEALRGRHDTARAMLEQARGTLEELGLRQGLLETELYAGIVELLAGDPVAAEPHLRAAHDGLGQLGIGADIGQAAAHLARSLMEQGRLDEARELANESEALAGQNPQTLIAARAVRAEILAATGSVGEALALADEAVALASGSDILVDHANAVAAQARVRAAAGDAAGAASAAAVAADLYEQKGAAVEVAVGEDSRSGQKVEAAADPDGHLAGEQTLEWWNEAHRLTADSLSRYAGADADGWAAQLTDDVVFDDRRSLVHDLTEGKDAVVHGWVDVLDVGSAPAGELSSLEPVAARGEHLLLFSASQSWSRGAVVVSFLGINRWTADGELDRIVFFDPDDLSAAVAELDRLYSETIGPADPESVEGYRRRFAALGRKDVDTFVRGFHPSLEAVDHRQLGWPVADFDGFAERTATLTGSVDHLLAYIERFHATGFVSRGWATRYRITMDDGSMLDERYLLLSRIDTPTGLVVQVEQFPEPDVSALVARCEELERAASPIETARVVRLGGYLNTTVRDDESVESLVAVASFAAETAGGETTSTGTDVSSLRAAGFGGVDRRVLAVRGERLALSDVGLDDGSRRYQVEEIDEEGRLVRVRRFGADGLVAALDHLDDRWLEIDAPLPAAAALGLELTRRARHGDVTGVAALLDDEFVAVDHRPGGFGRLDGQSFLALTPTTDDNPVMLIARAVLRTADRATVSLADLVPLDPTAPFEPLPSITVMEVRGGRVARLDFFHDDDMDGALAAFAELVEAERETFAERASRRLMDLHHAGDLDGFAALVAPDARHEDRRAGIASTMTRDDLGEATRWLIEEGMIGAPDSTGFTESLATSGARHLAIRQVLEQPGGFRIEVFSAVRHDLDGRLTRSIGTGTEAEALAALDELVAEEARSPELVNTMTMLFERTDGYEDATVLAALGDLTAMVRCGAGDHEELVVGLATPSGRIERIDRFAPTELESAYELLLEHSRRDGHPLAIPHPLFDRLEKAIVDEDLALLDELLDDDVQVVGHRELGVGTLDKGAFVTWVRETAAVRMTTITRKVHARADDAMVVAILNSEYSAGGWTTVDFVTLMRSRGGRIVALESWGPDDLPAALARFDELAGTDSEPRSLAATTFDRFTASGFSEEFLTPELVIDDRRRLARTSYEGEETVDGAHLLRSLDLTGYEVIATRGARLVAWHMEFRNADDFEFGWYGASEVDLDGRFVRSVNVDTEAEALAALADWEAEEHRSSELVNTMTMLFERAGDHAGSETLAVRGDLLAVVESRSDDGDLVYAVGRAAPTGEVVGIEPFAELNAALDRLDTLVLDPAYEFLPDDAGSNLEWAAAMRSGDPARIAPLMAADVEVVSHRALGAPEFGRDEWLEYAVATADLGMQAIGHKVHAHQRGHTVLTSATRTPTGETVVAVILTVNRDAVITRLEGWDPEDLPAALATFDALVEADAAPNLAARRALEWRAIGADVDAALGMASPDYRLDDRRAGSRMQTSGEEAVVAVATLIDGDATVTNSRSVATWGARHVVMEDRFTAENGFAIECYTVERFDVDGRIEIDIAVDTLDEATAALDELVAEELRTPDLVNTMTMILDRADGGADVEVLALVGDLVALVRNSTGGLEAFEATPMATIASRRAFAPDELAAALDHLDELREGHEHPPTPPAITRFAAAQRPVPDIDLLADLMTDDFMVVSNSAVAVDIPGKEGMLELFRASHDLSVAVLTQKRCAVAERMSAGLIVNVIREPDGTESIIPYAGIVSERDGRIDRMEWWDVEDVALMLMRFDELAAQEAGSNLAAEAIHAVVRSGRVDFTGLLAADFTVDDRRQGVRVSYASDETPDLAEGIESFPVRSYEILATAGARHVAWRVLLLVPGDYEIEWYGASRVDLDGRFTHSVSASTEEEVLRALDELEAEEARSPELVNTMTMRFDRMDGYEDAEVVAVAGDLCALLRRGPGDHGNGREFVLGWATPAGTVERVDEIGFGDLREVLDGWIAAGLAEEISPVFVEYSQAVDGGDIERLESLLDPHFEAVSHRRMVNSTFDRDEFLAYAEVLSPDGLFVLAKVHATDPTTLLSSAVRLEPSEGGDITVSPQVTLVRTDGPRVLGTEIWDPEDLPLALARFDELARGVDDPVGGRSRVAEVATRLGELVASGDLDRLDEVLEPDVDLEDRRSVVSAGSRRGIEAFRDLVVASGRAGLRGKDREVVARRGDDHVLMRSALVGSSGQRIERLVLWTLGPSGRLIRRVEFDPDDVMAAQEELNLAWAATLDPGPAERMRLGNEWIPALMAGDVERMERFLTPDFVHRDFRPLGLGQVDRAAFLELIRQRPTVVGDGYTIVSDLCFSGDATVGPYKMFQETPDGFSSVEEGVALFRGNGGSVSYMAVYPPEDLDRALADAEAIAADTARILGGIRANALVRKLGTWTRAVLADDYEGMADLLEPGIVIDDRRRLTSHGRYAGAPAVIEMAGINADLGLRNQGVEVLGVRGENHGLVRTRLAGETGDEIVRLMTWSLGPAGGLGECVIFDPDDIAAAHDELDRLWFESLTGRDAEVALLAAAAGDAAVAGDADALAGLVADDFATIDHRPMGAGSTGRDEYLALIRARRDTLGDSWSFARDRHIVGDCAVIEYEIFSRSPDHGVEATVAAIGLTHWVGNRADRYEAFAADQLDAALARAEELSRDLGSGSVRPNRAAMLMGQIGALGREARFDRLTEVFEDDVVVVDRRSTVSLGVVEGIDAVTAGIRASFEAGAGGAADQVERLAVRGDDHVLLRHVLATDAGLEIPRLLVGSLGVTGRIAEYTMFDDDDLERAQDELDRRWRATLDPVGRAREELSLSFRDAVVAGDADATDGLLTADFTSADRRRSGRWDLDRAAFLDMVGDRAATLGAGFQFVQDRLAVGDSVSLTIYEIHTTSPEHGIEAVDAAIAVGRTVDGRVDRLDLFDLDQLDDALAHAEELAAELDR